MSKYQPPAHHARDEESGNGESAASAGKFLITTFEIFD